MATSSQEARPPKLLSSSIPNGKKLGKTIDLFNAPDVVTTGVVSLGAHDLSAGKHKLTIEITGANPKAVKAYMFGLDYVKLDPAK